MRNADHYGRIESRLFKSYFDFNWNGPMVQGEARIGLIWESNGKFLQANGLVGFGTSNRRKGYPASIPLIPLFPLFRPLSTTSQISSAKLSLSLA
jgi:hypothetical protein